MITTTAITLAIVFSAIGMVEAVKVVGVVWFFYAFTVIMVRLIVWTIKAVCEAING
jgi:hypothetical protein